MQTGARGDADFNLLEPGRYTIHVESAGFEPADVARRPRSRWRQPARSQAGDREARRNRAGGTRPARARQRSAQRRVCDDARPGADRRAAGRPRRDGAGAEGHGRTRRRAARQRLPRRPAAAEGSDSADSLPPQHVRGRHARGRDSSPSTSRPSPASTAGAAPPTSAFRDVGAQRPQRVRADKRRRAARALRLFTQRAALEEHTSLAFSADGTDAFDSKTIVAALPSGYFADSIRKPNNALNLSAPLEHALSKSQMLRAEAAAQPHVYGQSRRRRLRPARARLQPDAHGQSCSARSTSGAIRQVACSTTFACSGGRRTRRTHPPASRPPC